MSHNEYVDKIVTLAALTEPRERPSESDWDAIEVEFGFCFPIDFKMLVSRLGSGSFGCGLTMLNPCSTVAHERLSKQCLASHRALVQNIEQKIGVRFFPSPGGAVLIARVDRQDFYLQGDKSSPKILKDLLWLNIDTDELMPIDFTFSRFIHDLFFGVIRERWAVELRAYFWRDGSLPFFTSTNAGR